MNNGQTFARTLELTRPHLRRELAVLCLGEAVGGISGCAGGAPVFMSAEVADEVASLVDTIIAVEDLAGRDPDAGPEWLNKMLDARRATLADLAAEGE